MAFMLTKMLHTFTAVLTICGFILRGYWMMRESPLLQHRVTKILPHVIDTLFLLAGIALVWMMGLNVFTQPWLLAKFAGLIAYIVLGTFALKRGKTMEIRVTAFVGALAVYAWVVGVAISKSPASWLAYFASELECLRTGTSHSSTWRMRYTGLTTSACRVSTHSLTRSTPLPNKAPASSGVSRATPAMPPTFR